jgi:hypothetical protein
MPKAIENFIDLLHVILNKTPTILKIKEVKTIFTQAPPNKLLNTFIIII